MQEKVTKGPSKNLVYSVYCIYSLLLIGATVVITSVLLG